MNIEIKSDGVMYINSESEIESYALQAWLKDNREERDYSRNIKFACDISPKVKVTAGLTGMLGNPNAK